MKILNIFCDMLRPDVLALFNDNILEKDELDIELEKLGGTIYKNAFSVNPDTGRGLAGLFTGRFAKNNGCTVMGQYPENYLNKELYNLNNLFEEKKIASYFLCKEDYYNLGYFPKGTKELIKIKETKRYDYKKRLKEVSSKVKREKDIFIFLTFSDFHDVMSVENYDKKKVKKGKEQLNKIISYIFKIFNKDDFDYIFIFSDHGCCYSEEKKDKLYLLNDNRTRITLQVRKKYESNIKENLDLKSILDIFPTWCFLYNKKIKSDGKILFKNDSNRKIGIESSSKFTTDIWAKSDLWAVITKNEIIITDKKKKIIFQNQLGKNKILPSSSLLTKEINDILKRETVFFEEKEIKIKKDIKKSCKRLFYSDGSFLKSEKQRYIYIYLRYLIARTPFYLYLKNIYKKVVK